VKNKRPVNLDLTTIHVPITAVVSILHRISGIVVFLFIPFILWMLGSSLSSAEHFAQIKNCFSSPLCRLVLWVLLSGLLYHLVAGIRHLLLDAHIGEDLHSGRIGANAVVVISIILIILAGIWLW
jgi:succinate dehydrogenase / fumarate reductase cytochrome b subunit